MNITEKLARTIEYMLAGLGQGLAQTMARDLAQAALKARTHTTQQSESEGGENE